MLHGLDAEQRAAVTTLASPLAIVAAAGSGKTTVLTRRIAYRSAHGTATPQHVLALTFTREAAAELKRRLRRLDIREPIEEMSVENLDRMLAVMGSRKRTRRTPPLPPCQRPAPPEPSRMA